MENCLMLFPAKCLQLQLKMFQLLISFLTRGLQLFHLVKVKLVRRFPVILSHSHFMPDRVISYRLLPCMAGQTMGFMLLSGDGIDLYSGEMPVMGEITSQVMLWDAGTEANQMPGSDNMHNGANTHEKYS